MSLLTDLVSYWKLDEASGTRFDSHGSNDLADNNTVGTGTGLAYGTAADFETGNSEYLSRASNSDLQAGDIDFTLAAWVKLESKDSSTIIVGKDASGGGNREYNLLYRSATDLFSFELFEATDSGTIMGAGALGSPSTGVWYFVVAWYDAAANLMWIQANNGPAESTSKGTLQAAGTAGFRIGAREFSGAESYFDGLIGPVMYWKRVLTSDERASLYNGGSGLAYEDFGGGGGGAITITLSPLSGTGVIVSPVAAASINALPSPVSGTGTLVAPSIPLNDVVVGPSALTGTGSVVASIILSAQEILAGPVTGRGTLVAPVAAAAVNLVAPALIGTGTVTAPVASAAVSVVLSPIVGQGTLTDTETFLATGALLDPLVGAGTLVAPVASAVVVVVLSAVAGAGTISTHTVYAGQDVILSAVSGAGTVVAPVAAAGTEVTLTPLTGEGELVSPAVDAGYAVGLTPLSGTGTLVAVVPTSDTVVLLSPIPARGTLPTVTITGGVTDEPPGDAGEFWEKPAYYAARVYTKPSELAARVWYSDGRGQQIVATETLRMSNRESKTFGISFAKEGAVRGGATLADPEVYIDPSTGITVGAAELVDTDFVDSDGKKIKAGKGIKFRVTPADTTEGTFTVTGRATADDDVLEWDGTLVVFESKGG